MGRFDEGMAQTKKAQELDPLSLIINTTLGWQFYVAGQNEERRRANCGKFWTSTQSFRLHGGRSREVYAHMGKQKEAVAGKEKKALSLSGGAELAASIEEDFKKSGYKGVLQSWLEGLTELSKHSLRLVLQHRGGLTCGWAKKTKSLRMAGKSLRGSTTVA